jgi:hypothetical protein
VTLRVAADIPAACEAGAALNFSWAKLYDAHHGTDKAYDMDDGAEALSSFYVSPGSIPTGSTLAVLLGLYFRLCRGRGFGWHVTLSISIVATPPYMHMCLEN